MLTANRRSLRSLATLLALVAALVFSGEAAATYPGANGKLAFSARLGTDTSNEIYTYDFVTQQLSRLTEAPGLDAEPSWNPDGSELVFASQREDASTKDCSTQPCDFELYTVAVDGTNETPLTDTANTRERTPAFSPDGRQIAFTSIEEATSVRTVRVVDADGSNSRLLFDAVPPHGQAQDPTWSPKGDRLAFANGSPHAWVGNADGTGIRSLGIDRYGMPSWSPYHDWVLLGQFAHPPRAFSPDSNLSYLLSGAAVVYDGPVWSPDMTRIALPYFGVVTERADGLDQRRVVSSDWPIYGLDWLAIPQPVPGYVRPKNAPEVRVQLVPAYQECTAPNAEHGPPLALGSCTPPAQGSDLLTVGTPDSNGRPARSIGSATILRVPGNLATHEDEADIALRLDISDVRRRSDLSDYTEFLVVPLEIRLTDRNNGCCAVGGPQAATIRFVVEFEFGAPCAATTDPDEGARCNIATTVDAISPNTVMEGLRTTWEIGPIRVFARTGSDTGGPFAVQGLFVP